MVQRKEVDDFLSEGKMKDLQDILHRTRLAKGTCQGGFCVFRLLGVLHELGIAEGDSTEVLKKFPRGKMARKASHTLGHVHKRRRASRVHLQGDVQP